MKFGSETKKKGILMVLLGFVVVSPAIVVKANPGQLQRNVIGEEVRNLPDVLFDFGESSLNNQALATIQDIARVRPAEGVNRRTCRRVGSPEI